MELEGAMVVQSTDVSSRLEKKRKTDGSSSSSSSSPPYEVLISMPLSEEGVLDDVQRWYIMKIHADAVDGAEGSISEVWRHRIPQPNSTFALLGSDLYSVGGRNVDYDRPPSLIDNVYKINIRHPAGSWIPVKSMISPRMFPHILVLGGKLYVLSGFHFSLSGVSPFAPGGEVYDPITDLWEALPDPPCYMGLQILSAALENPNRILVASLPMYPQGGIRDPHFRSFANFFIYEVQSCSWKMLDPARRKLRKFPIGPFMGRSVAVGNYLYWITADFQLLAYDFELNLWLTGRIKGLDFPVHGYDYPVPFPRLFHLEKERFCIIKFTTVRDQPRRLLHCILFDVSPVAEKNNLCISVVSNFKYETPGPTILTNGLLMMTTSIFVFVQFDLAICGFYLQKIMEKRNYAGVSRFGEVKQGGSAKSKENYDSRLLSSLTVF